MRKNFFLNLLEQNIQDARVKMEHILSTAQPGQSISSTARKRKINS